MFSLARGGRQSFAPGDVRSHCSEFHRTRSDNKATTKSDPPPRGGGGGGSAQHCATPMAMGKSPPSDPVPLRVGRAGGRAPFPLWSAFHNGSAGRSLGNPFWFAKGPPTANRQPPRTANRHQPPPTANHHQPGLMSYTQSFCKTAGLEHFFSPLRTALRQFVPQRTDVPPCTCGLAPTQAHVSCSMPLLATCLLVPRDGNVWCIESFVCAGQCTSAIRHAAKLYEHSTPVPWIRPYRHIPVPGACS